MSIYATLWRLKFPGRGDDHTDCEWVDVLAQGVPSHVGALHPDTPTETTDPYASFLPSAINVPPDDDDPQLRAEYVDPLLVLSGREYAVMPFAELHHKICNALRGDRPRLVAEAWEPDGRVRLGTVEPAWREVKPGRFAACHLH